MKYFFFIVLIILLCLGIFLLPPIKPIDKSEIKAEIDSEVQIYKKPVMRRFSSKLQDRLDKIMIDHIEFEDASISAVVNLLRVRAKDLDPEKKGINIVLLLGNDVDNIRTKFEEEDEEDFLREGEDKDDELIDEAVREGGEQAITIMFDDLSLSESIRNICIAADMRYRVEEHAVIIASKNVALSKLETRIYPIEQDAFSEMGVNDNDNGKPVSVKDYFQKCGIPFPGASRIVYDSAISRIIATNTSESLRRIKTIIDDLNVIDPQVLITSRFIKIPEHEYRKIKKEYKKHVSADSSEFIWNKILKADSTEIIASATILSKNGEEANIRMVREVYFPESWGEGATAPTNASSDDDEKKEIKKSYPPNGQILSSTAMPEFGEPTELGVRLVVTPTVDSDKYTISIDAIPVIQYFIGWTSHANGVRMPIIKTWTNNSQHTLYDGHTILAGSTLEDVYNHSTKNREKNRFMLLLTARLVKPNGINLRDATQTTNSFAQTVKASLLSPRLNATEKRLAKLRLKHINFTDVNIQTTVEYISEELRTQNKDIRIILRVNEEDFANISTSTVTLNLEDIPLLDVIRYICMQTNLEYSIKNNDILIAQECDPMETRYFNLRARLLTRASSKNERSAKALKKDNKKKNRLQIFISQQGVHLPTGSSITFDPLTGKYTVDTTATKFEDYPTYTYNPITSQLLSYYFMERGVSFSSESYIKYNRTTGKLIVHNTSGNLSRLEKLLRCLDLDQPQVLVECTIAEIGNQELIKLLGKDAALSDNLNQDQIEKIITSKACKTLTSQEVVSKSGEEANIRLANETYFPESWTEPELGVIDGFISPTDAYPEFGEAADVGTRFIVTPTVRANNYTITLNLNPQILKMLGWSKYEPVFIIDTGATTKTSSSKVAMPKLGLKYLQSRIKLYSGKTIFAGKTQLLDFPDVKKGAMTPNTDWTTFLRKAKENGNRSKNIYFFIKATIVNPDGEGI